MPIPTFTKTGPNPTFNDLVTKINTIVGELSNLMLNLDSLNVVEINAGTLVIYDLDGGPGTITINKDGMVVNNGTVDTFKVDIDGNVTMTSALIQSAAGYPKVVMDPNTILFGAYLDANNYFELQPSVPGIAAPTLFWVSGGSTASQLYTDTSKININAIARDIVLSTEIQGNIDIQPAVGYSVFVPSWFSFLNSSSGQSLQSDLDEKANVDEAGYNLTFDNGTRNLKMFNKNGDQIASVNIPT